MDEQAEREQEEDRERELMTGMRSARRRGALGPVKARAGEPDSRPPTSRPYRIPEPPVADAEACAGLAEIHSQAGDQRNAAVEAKAHRAPRGDAR